MSEFARLKNGFVNWQGQRVFVPWFGAPRIVPSAADETRVLKLRLIDRLRPHPVSGALLLRSCGGWAALEELARSSSARPRGLVLFALAVFLERRWSRLLATSGRQSPIQSALASWSAIYRSLSDWRSFVGSCSGVGGTILFHSGNYARHLCCCRLRCGGLAFRSRAVASVFIGKHDPRIRHSGQFSSPSVFSTAAASGYVLSIQRPIFHRIASCCPTSEAGPIAERIFELLWGLAGLILFGDLLDDMMEDVLASRPEFLLQHRLSCVRNGDASAPGTRSLPFFSRHRAQSLRCRPACRNAMRASSAA